MMVIQNPPSGAATTLATDIASHAATTPGSKRWLSGAFLLAGAAQLITISALLSSDPVPATWAALLLATAPAPLAATAAFTRGPIASLGTLAATLVLIVGITGTVLHTGLFFAPALVLLVVGSAKLWGEQR